MLAALADPSRLRIVRLLSAMDLSVGELADVLGQSQPRVSRHVRILADAGLAERRKEGAWVFVRLRRHEVAAPLLAWLAALPHDAAAAADTHRLHTVRAERDAAAAAWFTEHAEQWDSLTALHAADTAVETAIAALLADRPLGRLLDVGTGTGRMLALLGAQAQHATGIDRSAEMLRIARAKLGGHARVEVRQGDMHALPVPDASADTVVLHQVLHFATDPARAVAEAARVLAPGGRLLIVDFAAHDHENLRDRFVHQRLGFDPQSVCGWLSAAGLDASVARRFPGELSVVIWLATRPPAALRQVA